MGKFCSSIKPNLLDYFVYIFLRSTGSATIFKSYNLHHCQEECSFGMKVGSHYLIDTIYPAYNRRFSGIAFPV